MAEDYLYDVFISYRHKPPVLDWVRNHFYPLLDQWLPSAMPVEPKIFIDFDEIEIGAAWPAKLRQALRQSRCILSVWSPEYFRSEWCLAEWQTFRERERLLELATEQQPDGLIYPVVFSDGEHFPPEAVGTQLQDLRDWNTPHQVFRETAAYVEFDNQMQTLVKGLAKTIGRAPAWQDWPIITPPAKQQVIVKLPRL
ncbi:MAG: toll/interleukin-1 receptor domain-containing protein [Acidobacteriota bacterium]|nr:toll/interleukin-1 receptor domain-containing protein [Acidobacteriota bacterium]